MKVDCGIVVPSTSTKFVAGPETLDSVPPDEDLTTAALVRLVIETGRVEIPPIAIPPVDPLVMAITDDINTPEVSYSFKLRPPP